MSLQILPMSHDHLPAVAALEQCCFSTPWSEHSLLGELQKPDAIFLVAVQQGELCGYIGLNTVLDEGYITNVAVHPHHRRQGIARSLLLALLHQGNGRELAFITLEVRPSNTPALALYSGLGFTEQGRRRGFYTHPDEDGLLMTYYY